MSVGVRHMVRFRRGPRLGVWHASVVPVAICPVCRRVIVRGRGEWWTRPLSIGELLTALDHRPLPSDR